MESLVLLHEEEEPFRWITEQMVKSVLRVITAWVECAFFYFFWRLQKIRLIDSLVSSEETKDPVGAILQQLTDLTLV